MEIKPGLISLSMQQGTLRGHSFICANGMRGRQIVLA